MNFCTLAAGGPEAGHHESGDQRHNHNRAKWLLQKLPEAPEPGRHCHGGHPPVSGLPFSSLQPACHCNLSFIMLKRRGVHSQGAHLQVPSPVNNLVQGVCKAAGY